MANFPLLATGERDDRVRIVLDDREVHIFKHYEVQKRYLQVPSVFSFVVGSGTTALDLMQRFPPNTKFMLKVGPELPQFQGHTDGYAPENSQGATELMLRGRDVLAPIVDGHIRADKSFSNATFHDLAIAAIEGSGLKNYRLETSREGTRNAVTGTPVIENVEVEAPLKDLFPFVGSENAAAQKGTPTTFKNDAGNTVITNNPAGPFNIIPPTTTEQRVVGYHTASPIKAKAGETWYAFTKKQFDRGGLFLHGGVDPEGQRNVLILSEPSAKQEPVAMLIRQRGSPRNQNAVNILRHRHRNEIQGRSLTYIVQGRASNGSNGRHRIEGQFVDDEMAALGFVDPQKTFVHQNDEAKSVEHAEYLARRACAEARRQNWTLVYTVKGHIAPFLPDPSQYTVWDIDTVVRVLDEELGIEGNFWIEGVCFRCGNDGTTTELTLMRPEDLVFGEGEFYTGPKPKKPGHRGRLHT
jgi:prophage tail gpP-like protein